MVRFTEQQRKVLLMSWEYGFLCDCTNYGSISEITGLTRKQISNWATARRKCCNDCLPPKNPAQIKTNLKDLLECNRSCSTIGTPQYIPQRWQPSRLNAGQTEQYIPIAYTQTDERKLNRYGQSRSDGTMQCLAKNEAPQPSKSFEPLKLEAKVKLSINQFILQVALQGIESVSDQTVDIMADLSNIEPDEIRCWLVTHGWKAKSAEHGILYVRIASA